MKNITRIKPFEDRSPPLKKPSMDLFMRDYFKIKLNPSAINIITKK